MMQRLTNGLYHSTLHRVMNNLRSLQNCAAAVFLR
jgi:isopenicillin N synthase-like dioxygenase